MKDVVKKELGEQKHVEWSDYERRMLKEIMEDYEEMAYDANSLIAKDEYYEKARFIKSILL